MEPHLEPPRDPSKITPSDNQISTDQNAGQNAFHDAFNNGLHNNPNDAHENGHHDPLHEDLLENQNRSRPKHGHPGEQDDGEKKELSLLECAELFGKSFSQSAFQEPLNGLIQLEDNTPGLSQDYALPQLDLIKELPDQKLGSRAWYAQTLGSGFGSVLPFISIELATRGAGGSAAWRALRARADGAPIVSTLMGADKASHYFSHLGKTTLDGTIYGASFVPVSEPDNDFWQQRAKNVLAVGLTFGTQNAISHGVLNAVERSGVGHMHFHDETTLTVKSAAWHMGANMIGGATAAVVGAESLSSLYGQGPAKLENLENAAGSFAVTGLALDFAHVGELKLAGRLSKGDGHTADGEKSDDSKSDDTKLDHGKSEAADAEDKAQK